MARAQTAPPRQSPHETYQSLMQVIRERFDAVAVLRLARPATFPVAEAAAFHGRKIVEGIAFACLVAVEHGTKDVPREARGQWSAEAILYRLRKKGYSVLPSPTTIRAATAEEYARDRVRMVGEGVPERRLTHEELIAIYTRLHAWNHEINPYVHADRGQFLDERGPALWEDLDRLRAYVERHVIAIQGEAFVAVLWDSQDGRTKVMAVSRRAEEATIGRHGRSPEAGRDTP